MRKATRRRHYPVVPVLKYVMEGVRPLSDAKLQQLQDIENRALEAFRTGTAADEHWSVIAGVVNLAEALATMGVGKEEVLPVCRLVEQHLGETHERYGRTQRLGTTGPGLQAMQDLCEYHQLQRTSVDVATFQRAVQTTMDRIRNAHPDVKVYLTPQPAAAMEPAAQ